MESERACCGKARIDRRRHGLRILYRGNRRRVSMCELHKPPCPSSTTRWRCGHRSEIERLVEAGELDRAKALVHLAKYGVPMSPPKIKAYRGEAPKKVSERLW